MDAAADEALPPPPIAIAVSPPAEPAPEPPPAVAAADTDSSDCDSDAEPPAPAAVAGDAADLADDAVWLARLQELVAQFPVAPSSGEAAGAGGLSLGSGTIAEDADGGAAVEEFLRAEDPGADAGRALQQHVFDGSESVAAALAAQVPVLEAMALESPASAEQQSASRQLAKGAKKIWKAAKKGSLETLKHAGSLKPGVVASYPDLRLSEYVLSFGFAPAAGAEGDDDAPPVIPLRDQHSQTVTLTNLGAHKAHFSTRVVASAAASSSAYTLTVDPPSGIVRSGHRLDVHVNLTVKQSGCVLEELLVFEVAGARRVFAAVRGVGERSLFGVAPRELPMAAAPAAGVPQVLEDMREYLVAADGLTTTGIFRLAPDEHEMAQVKRQLNQGTFVECRDVNCIATLIKVWFRELPVPLLDVVPMAAIIGVEEEAHCLAALESVPALERRVLEWLLDLCAQVVMNEGVNKMSAKNVAIVIGPNLFDPADSSVPMQALVFSQKSVQFLELLLLRKLREEYSYSSSPPQASD